MATSSLLYRSYYLGFTVLKPHVLPVRSLYRWESKFPTVEALGNHRKRYRQLLPRINLVQNQKRASGHQSRESPTPTYYYDVLGVAHDATPTEIKSAFYKMAKLHHPDVSTSPDSQKVFVEIQKAYEVLGDLKKRQLYDQQREYSHRHRYKKHSSSRHPDFTQAPPPHSHRAPTSPTPPFVEDILRSLRTLKKDGQTTSNMQEVRHAMSTLGRTLKPRRGEQRPPPLLVLHAAVTVANFIFSMGATRGVPWPVMLGACVVIVVLVILYNTMTDPKYYEQQKYAPTDDF